MFNSKQKTLFTENKTTQTSGNSFVKAGLKAAATTTNLGNGAVKFTTTGNDFVDQFGKATNYRAARTFAEISKDMQLLYSQSKLTALRFLFYLRMITRTVVLPNGNKTETTQRGQGLKHEGIFRMMWLAVNEPNVFWKNIALFISVGSWKDIVVMLNYDLQYNGWNNRKLDWPSFGKLLLVGLENSATSELVKKYLPQIKANSQCKTLEAQADNIIAKWLCSLLFGGKQGDYSKYKLYRKLKTSGTAHQWQQLISKGKHQLIDFNTIHGRALAQLVSGKYLKNNNLSEKYQKWIEAQPVAKYTGYVYELLSPVKKGYKNQNLEKYKKDTINKQFYGLIETAKKGMLEKESGYLVVVDSSSSMTGVLSGTKVCAYDVAKSMALYFSYLLKGAFAGTWMEFNNNAELKRWIGDNPVDQLQNDHSEAYGSTNFQSVAKVFASIKKQGVSENDFPKGILCISDGCFNNNGRNKTETKTLKANLLASGFSKEFVDNFKIVLWDIPNNYYGKSQTAFEEFADCPNLFYFGGLDGAAVAFLTGTQKQKETPKNAAELFEAAMQQEVLNLLTI